MSGQVTDRFGYARIGNVILVFINDHFQKAKEFPDETWVEADKLKLDHVSMPKDVTGILVAKSRLPINKQEELDFLKEIISAILNSKQ